MFSLKDEGRWGHWSEHAPPLVVDWDTGGCGLVSMRGGHDALGPRFGIQPGWPAGLDHRESSFRVRKVPAGRGCGECPLEVLAGAPATPSFPADRPVVAHAGAAWASDCSVAGPNSALPVTCKDGRREDLGRCVARLPGTRWPRAPRPPSACLLPSRAAHGFSPQLRGAMWGRPCCGSRREARARSLPCRPPPRHEK